MKIIFVSGVKFGYDLLSYVLKNGYKISLIVSYEDSKKNNYSDYVSFDDLANKYKIKNLKVKNINDEENIQIIKKINPDLILVMGWSQILKEDIINIPSKGVIGSHPTELPKFRGRAPIPWSIIKGLKKSALTFFYIEEGVDNGDIMDQCKFTISENDDATIIYNKITQIGKKMLVKNLRLLESGKTNRKKQDNSNFIENWPKRVPDEGMIDWSKSSKEIHTLIRATTHPYPGAFTFFKGLKLKIWKASYLDKHNLDIGKIIDVNENEVTIGTGHGTIIIEKISENDNPNTKISKIFSKNDIGLLLGK